MDTFDRILRSRPRSLVVKNSAGTGQVDLMARVTPSGSPINGPSVVYGAKWSMHCYNSVNLYVPTTVFIRGSENTPFTLEARLALTRDNTDTFSVLSHNAAYDGLHFVNNVIHFKVEFNTVGSIDLSWEADTVRKARTYHAVYNVSKVQLFVDAELVAEEEVTAEQRADGFKTRATSNLHVAQSSAASNTREMDVGYLAIYNKALGNDRMWVHYNAATDGADYQEVSTAYGGVDLIGSRNVYANQLWNSDNWTDGQLTDVAASPKGRLIPAVDSAGDSIAGTWIGHIDLDSAGSNIYGVTVAWDGRGDYSIETSINSGSTWSAATNGRYATGTFNLDPTGIIMMIKVTFDGSITDDTSEIEWLRLTAYADANVYTSDYNRTVVVEDVDAVMDTNNYLPISARHSHQGIRSYSSTNGSYLTADADPNTTFSVKAIEFWFWMTSTSNNVIFDNTPNGGSEYVRSSVGNTITFSGGTLYVEGTSVSSGSTSLAPGRVHHCLFILTGTANERWEIGSPSVIIPMAKIYATAPADPTLLFESHTLDNTELFASESLSVSDATTPFKLYDYDWTTASGR